MEGHEPLLFPVSKVVEVALEFPLILGVADSGVAHSVVSKKGGSGVEVFGKVINIEKKEARS